MIANSLYQAHRVCCVPGLQLTLEVTNHNPRLLQRPGKGRGQARKTAHLWGLKCNKDEQPYK